MVLEVGIVCWTIWAIFGDWFDAKAELLREQAREKQLANDKKEFGNDRSDEERS